MSTDRVAVWTVLRRPVASVALEIWLAPEKGGSSNALVAEGTRPTIQIGEELFFALSMATTSTGAPLEPGRVYAYDLLFDGRSLGELGLLTDGEIAGHRHLALGYLPGLLPTFVVPPHTAEELVLTHGSCRRPYAAGRDGLVALDQIIERGRNPSPEHPRPHFCFHTGDQIYGDDVSPELLDWLSAAGERLIGRNGDGDAIERVRIDLPDESAGSGVRTQTFPVDRFHLPPGRRQRLLTRAAGYTSSDNHSHAIGVGEFVAHYLFSWCNILWPRLDDRQTWAELLSKRGEAVRDYVVHWRAHFETARRLRAAGHDLPEHIDTRLRYLEGWRLLPLSSRAIDRVREEDVNDWNAGPDWDAFWGPTAPRPATPAEVSSAAPDSALLRGNEANLRALAALLTPPWYAGAAHFGVGLDYELDRDDAPASADEIRLQNDTVLTHLRRLRRFYQGLPNARRALANVSNLMMFDDHEVSDDWNITREWTEKVAARSLGRDAVGNALVAYALCQDWGNDPGRYEPPGADEEPTPNRQLLEVAQTLFRSPAGGAARTDGPPAEQRAALDLLVGLGGGDRRGQVVWHWRVTDGNLSPYEILALDNRTRRGFDLLRSSPANLSDEALGEQIPKEGPGGSAVTVVIAPLPPLGFPPIEQVGQPIINLMDEYQKDPRTVAPSRMKPFPEVRRDYSFGRLFKDPEPWGFHPHALEALFERLSSRRAVVFLSGDVHYSLSARMTYWRGVTGAGGPRLEPVTRFVQLTCSALQNEPGVGEMLLTHQAMAQQFGAVFTGPFDRLGWRSAGVDGPSLPSEQPLSSLLRRLLQQEPVLIPTRMLPDDVLAALRARTLPAPPEWAWRLTQLKDERPDAERYEVLAGARAEWTLPTDAEVNADPIIAARRIANHHRWHSQNGLPRRLLMHSSVGLVRFLPPAEAGSLALVHELYAWDRTGAGPGGGPPAADRPWPDALMAAHPFVQHRTTLDPSDELSPDTEPP